MEDNGRRVLRGRGKPITAQEAAHARLERHALKGRRSRSPLGTLASANRTASPVYQFSSPATKAKGAAKIERAKGLSYTGSAGGGNTRTEAANEGATTPGTARPSAPDTARSAASTASAALRGGGSSDTKYFAQRGQGRCEGYLYKLKRASPTAQAPQQARSWSKRFCVLHGSRLCFYRSRRRYVRALRSRKVVTEAGADGWIPLHHVVGVRRSSHARTARDAFLIVSETIHASYPRTKELMLRAPSGYEADAWVASLRHVLDHPDEHGVVPPPRDARTGLRDGPPSPRVAREATEAKRASPVRGARAAASPASSPAPTPAAAPASPERRREAKRASSPVPACADSAAGGGGGGVFAAAPLADEQQPQQQPPSEHEELERSFASQEPAAEARGPAPAPPRSASPTKADAHAAFQDAAHEHADAAASVAAGRADAADAYFEAQRKTEQAWEVYHAWQEEQRRVAAEQARAHGMTTSQWEREHAIVAEQQQAQQQQQQQAAWAQAEEAQRMDVWAEQPPAPTGGAAASAFPNPLAAASAFEDYGGEEAKQQAAESYDAYAAAEGYGGGGYDEAAAAEQGGEEAWEQAWDATEAAWDAHEAEEEPSYWDEASQQHGDQSFDRSFDEEQQQQQQAWAAADPQGFSASLREEAPRAWVEQYDAESGHPYWLNGATGESTWERPAECVSMASVAEDAEAEALEEEPSEEDRAQEGGALWVQAGAPAPAGEEAAYDEYDGYDESGGQPYEEEHKEHSFDGGYDGQQSFEQGGGGGEEGYAAYGSGASSPASRAKAHARAAEDIWQPGFGAAAEEEEGEEAGAYYDEGAAAGYGVEEETKEGAAWPADDAGAWAEQQPPDGEAKAADFDGVGEEAKVSAEGSLHIAIEHNAARAGVPLGSTWTEEDTFGTPAPAAAAEEEEAKASSPPPAAQAAWGEESDEEDEEKARDPEPHQAWGAEHQQGFSEDDYDNDEDAAVAAAAAKVAQLAAAVDSWQQEEQQVAEGEAEAERYERLYDEGSGCYYTFDTVTGESTWE